MRIKGHNLRIITEAFIYIEDGGKSLPIENNIDIILKYLNLFLGNIGNRRVLYKDQYGQMIEAVLTPGRQIAYFKDANNDPLIAKIKLMLKE